MIVRRARPAVLAACGAAACGAAACWAVACGAPPAGGGAIVLVDAVGREVRLDGPARRVVSVAPSLTEIVAAVGGESVLVGVTIHCDRPPSVAGLPTTGSYVRPDIEKIVALRPDLVLLVREGPSEADVGKMRDLGLPVAVLQTRGFDDVLANARWIATALGDAARGEAVARDLAGRYEAVRRAVAGGDRPRVLYAIALDPVIAPGRASFLHELIEDAGGVNVAGDLDAPYPRLSLEAVIDRAPDVILFSGGMGSEATAARQRAYWRRFPAIPAVRRGRLVEIDAGLINRPGPRMPEALAEVAAAIRPDRAEAIHAAAAPRPSGP